MDVGPAPSSHRGRRWRCRATSKICGSATCCRRSSPRATTACSGCAPARAGRGSRWPRTAPDPRLLLPVAGAVPPADLDPAALKVLARIDGVRSLDEIALREGLGLFSAQLAALALVEAGLAKMPDVPELVELAKQREAAGDVR